MEDGRLFDPTPTLTVGEVNRRLGVAIDKAFGDEIWVQGEISGLSSDRRPDTNLFFDLVEPGPGNRPAAKLRVALFAEKRRGVNALLRRAGGVRMADGLDVRIRGSVGFFRRQGSVQLRMTAIDPEHTLGRMAASRDRILADLVAEGLVARNGALPLSPVPLRVGLVTSAGSAAGQDFLHELEASGLGWSVRIVDARVQGRDAEHTVARGLRTAAHGVDVVALIRGGGARTDLAAFDSDLIARTIADLGVPVLTGLGHEIDRSIADEVAHTAQKTPTAAAAFLVDRCRNWLDRAEAAWRSVADVATRATENADRALADRAASARRRVVGSLDRADARLATITHQAGAASGLALDRADAELSRAAATVTAAGPRALVAADRALDGQARAVAALDPQRVLARGFSITRAADGSIVRHADDVEVGHRLHTTVAEGDLVSRVEESET
jgi:exodeoxyribonuclease VII large subunit